MMTNVLGWRRRACTGTVAAAVAAALVLAAPAGAQHWRNIPGDGVPLGSDGKPDMSAPAPRWPSGAPDLSGIYQPTYRYFQNLAADLGLEHVPMTGEARKIHAARATGLLGWEEPDAHCLPQGVPKINQAPVPFKIVQTEKLVVETRGLNGRQWMDHGGLPASDKLTVTERFRRPAFGRLEIEYTIDDPTYYTRPWTATAQARFLPGTELFEFICNENEKSTQHMGPNIK